MMLFLIMLQQEIGGCALPITPSHPSSFSTTFTNGHKSYQAQEKAMSRQVHRLRIGKVEQV